MNREVTNPSTSLTEKDDSFWQQLRRCLWDYDTERSELWLSVRTLLWGIALLLFPKHRMFQFGEWGLSQWAWGGVFVIFGLSRIWFLAKKNLHARWIVSLFSMSLWLLCVAQFLVPLTLERALLISGMLVSAAN